MQRCAFRERLIFPAGVRWTALLEDNRFANAYARRRTAMAITQINTHRRNRHGSWRDGEGGALDAPRPRTLDWMEAPTQRRQRRAAKATSSRLGTKCNAGLRTAPLEDDSLSTPALAVGRNAFTLALPVDNARPRIFARMPRSHPHPRIASMAYSRRSRLSLSLSQLTAHQARRGSSTGASRARAEQALTY